VPSVEANLQQWGRDYEWPNSGDEWSAMWGGADAQWHFTVRPRVRAFLPAASILEIAPGFGRWTNYLLPVCDRYVGVDLSSAAVEACRERFANVGHAEFHVNDGTSLGVVPDASVDFAFSFDSLVHVEADAIAGYVDELARVLKPDGVALIHHSNLAGCKPVGRVAALGLEVGQRLSGRETIGFDHWRASTMSAHRMEELARQAGLTCAGQEVLNWLGGRLIDCISLVTRPGSKWDRPNRVVENPYFTAEAASSACAAQVYGGVPLQPSRRIARIASMRVGAWAVSIAGFVPKPRASS
jgi:ubiquinone/menaquinone biosynthesis C-methylase UbiE